ncbi:MAG: hypothetical protein AAB405_02425 [Patescibacteria group bacterium]
MAEELKFETILDNSATISNISEFYCIGCDCHDCDYNCEDCDGCDCDSNN